MSNFGVEIPLPLCGHDRILIYSRRYKAECPVCKSFWDLDALNSAIVYDHNYPAARSHFDPAVGKNKIKTLQYWLMKTHIELKGLTVCEIGFGGGFCLKYLSEYSKQAFGVEAIYENIDHAMKLGIQKDVLFLEEEVPQALSSKIDLWIFQDSFEHLPNPSAFMQWLTHNSSDSSKILLVAPKGDSISERVLGKLWPHKIADHRFHWSSEGIIEFFSKRGFIVERSFYPHKYVSMQSVLAHTLLKSFPRGFRNLRRSHLPHIVFRFNIGEMGFLFGRTNDHEC